VYGYLVGTMPHDLCYGRCMCSDSLGTCCSTQSLTSSVAASSKTSSFLQVQPDPRAHVRTSTWPRSAAALHAI
jgi:hypothetical protein